MRKIYLASDSKARKKLLDIFGLKFEVVSVCVDEKKEARGLSYAQLVKTNALKKAEEAARRVRRGIIIAADTIVVQGRKIYGKPKDLAAARLMLKKLSSGPQWLYTGVAVLDLDKKKKLLEFEKTKVYMDKLADREIRSYFSSTSPLDKAGSFDIQGRGAFFIRRIEGCFYNVVGLPVRRLYRMLKKLNVHTLMLLLGAGLLMPGCATEYNVVTKQEEAYFYSTDREVRLGQSIDRQVQAEYKTAVDPLIEKRVEDIGRKIAAVCDRKDIEYHFRVIEDDQVNAVSLPGGYVYIFSGLVDKVKSDDELAGVIAHEVGHIVARHSIKKLQASTAITLLRVLISQAPQTSQASGAADMAITEIMLGYSREDELLADQLSARYLKLAGYNPRGMIDFLTRLQEIERRKPPRPYNYYKTHPYVPDRIRVVKQELGEGISFDDYINIEQMPHQ